MKISDLWFVRALVLVNGAVPIAMLAYDANAGALGANPVNFALHTTGLVALVFFLLSLAVTPLQRFTGHHELVAGRRALGLYGFFYLVVHFGIFFVCDRAGSVSSLTHEILTRRYLQIGTIGLLLFTPLAVTATDRMITRLGARRWKRLHRLSYVATSLGAIHYLLLVKSDIRQPLAFAGVLGGLLLLRLVPKARRERPWTGDLRIASVTQETHDVRTFRLEPIGGGKLPFSHRAGQHLNVRDLNRSYTISSAPGACEITVKRPREVLHEGAIVKVTAPLGSFVFEGKGTEDVLLIAGGVGITPLMAMIRTLTDRRWRGRIDLLYSVHSKKDVVFGAELEERRARFDDLHVTTSSTRLDRTHFTRIAKLTTIPIYLCGPDGMMAAMRELLAELGVPPKNIHTEMFVSPRAALDDAAPAGTFNVQIGDAVTTAQSNETLLEAAEELGIDIPSDCRAGICGQCKSRLVRGEVFMPVQDALTAEDRRRHLVLACQARPRSDVVIEG